MRRTEWGSRLRRPSRNTVKWHLQHIYAALGVSRQFELAQLVASLADLPGARG